MEKRVGTVSMSLMSFNVYSLLFEMKTLLNLSLGT